MTNVFTVEQYREWVDQYLDRVENTAEGHGEHVILVGSPGGNVGVRAPSQKYDCKRIDGPLTFHEDVFADPSGIAPLGDVMTTPGLRRLLGTIAVPRDVLSEQAEGVIDDQQDDLDQLREEESDEGGESA